MATDRADKRNSEEGAEATPASAPAATRRIAGGTIARAVGEAVAKVASVLFYVVLARELGEATFGDFVFGLSLAGVLLTMAAFGTDDLIAREVAKDHDRVHHLFADTLALKLGLGAVGMVIIAVILVIGGYPAETQVAVLLLAVAVWIEVLTKTVQAVMQGREEMTYIAASLIVQRVSTAVVGTAILLAGADLIAVAGVMVGGSLLGLLSALYWLYRRVSRPRREIDRARWMPLIKAGVPLGLVGILYILLLKLDASLLSFLKGGDNTEVGQYGAAFRLIEATMFISWAFGGAVLPWFSRHGDGWKVPLARGYELGLKGMVAMLVPIAVFFGVLAEPIIELLYGDAYDGAIVPLQLLALMTVLYGINTYVSVLMIARDRPSAFIRPATVVLVQNVIFNFILIPPLGATGAAINAVVSGVLLAVLCLRASTAIVGRISLVGALAPSAIAGAAMAGVLVATGSTLFIPFLIASAVVYAGVFLAIERLFFPDDYSLYVDLIKRRRSEEEEAELPASAVAAPGGLEP
jgi:O-antigen/teichoic acid export membrane protein